MVGSGTTATATRRSPLADPTFRWYLGGRLVSLLGSAMTPVALAFAVLRASGRATDLGVVLAAQSIPLVAFLLLGGAIADRFRRSTVLLVSHAGAGITQAAVATILLTGAWSLPLVAALEVVNGTLAAFTAPALLGIVPQLVGREQVQRANSLLGTSQNIARAAGPSLAGLLVVTVGGGWAVAADAASFLIAAACLTRVRLPRPASSGASVLGDIRAGWGEFRSRTWVWVVVLVFSVMNAVWTGVWGVLGPVIAEQGFGAGAWGVVLSANAVGLLVAGLVLYRVSFSRLLMAGQLGVALGGVPLALLGLHAPVPLLVVAAFVAGLGASTFGVAWDTSLQEHVPGHALSRVASYDALGSYVAIPVGQLAVVPIALAAGSARVAVAAGGIYSVLALAALLSRSVRDVRHEVDT